VLRGAGVGASLVAGAVSLCRVTIAAAGAAIETLARATSAQTRSRGVSDVCFVELIVPPVDAARDVRWNITGAPSRFRRWEDSSVAATAVLRGCI
jgi:hypothetical protein